MQEFEEAGQSVFLLVPIWTHTHTQREINVGEPSGSSRPGALELVVEAQGDASSSSDSTSSSNDSESDSDADEADDQPAPAASSSASASAPVIAEGQDGPVSCVVSLRNGIITYFYNTQRMVAHCEVPSHGKRCFLDRTAKAPSRLTKKNRGQGRPSGLLAAWLHAGTDMEGKTDKAKQKAHFKWRPTLERRRLGRLLFDTCENSEELKSKERPMREGELAEPESEP